MSIEAMKQALEALEAAAFSFRNVDAITALRTAIEQAEKQDGDCQQCGGQGCVACDARKQEQFGPQEILQMIVDRALEKPAAQRQWVGLTDEEAIQVAIEIDIEFKDEGREQQEDDIQTFARAIEAKLKEKNGY